MLNSCVSWLQVSNLRHPFIVPHLDSWVSQGHTVNIIYGYCEKGDLGTLLHKQKVRSRGQEVEAIISLFSLVAAQMTAVKPAEQEALYLIQVINAANTLHCTYCT